MQTVDLYTISAAAELLSTTRQTVYNHIKKDPGTLTTETASGKRLITLQGLAILEERLQNKPGRAAKPEGVDITGNRRNHTALKAEIERVNKLNQVQAAELERLSRLVTDLTSKVSSLEEDKTYLKTQLDKALDKRLTIFDRVIKRLTAGKKE